MKHDACAGPFRHRLPAWILAGLLLLLAGAESVADDEAPLAEQLEAVRSEAQAYRAANADLKARLERLQERLDSLQEQDQQEASSTPPGSQAETRTQAKSQADPL